MFHGNLNKLPAEIHPELDPNNTSVGKRSRWDI
jgi:hypothetical protein